MKKIKTVSYSLGINRGGNPRARMTYTIEDTDNPKSKILFINSGFSVSLDLRNMKAIIIPLNDPSDIQVTDITIEECEDL